MSVMQARRALRGGQPFTPRSLAGLVLWLDAGQIPGLVDGDPIGTWPDLSGLGNHATQATAAKKPLYKTGIVNGRPVVRFDGVDDFLAAVDANSLDLATLTAYIVWSGTSTRGLLAKRGSSASCNYELFANFGGWNGTTFDGPADATAGIKIGSWTWAATTLQGYKNGVALTATALAIGAANALDLNIGASTPTTEFLTGDVAEIILCGGLHADGTRKQTERYLGAKYGIVVA